MHKAYLQASHSNNIQAYSNYAHVCKLHILQYVSIAECNREIWKFQWQQKLKKWTFGFKAVQIKGLNLNLDFGSHVCKRHKAGLTRLLKRGWARKHGFDFCPREFWRYFQATVFWLKSFEMRLKLLLLEESGCFWGQSRFDWRIFGRHSICQSWDHGWDRRRNVNFSKNGSVFISCWKLVISIFYFSQPATIA